MAKRKQSAKQMQAVMRQVSEDHRTGFARNLCHIRDVAAKIVADASQPVNQVKLAADVLASIKHIGLETFAPARDLEIFHLGRLVEQQRILRLLPLAEEGQRTKERRIKGGKETAALTAEQAAEIRTAKIGDTRTDNAFNLAMSKQYPAKPSTIRRIVKGWHADGYGKENLDK